MVYYASTTSTQNRMDIGAGAEAVTAASVSTTGVWVENNTLNPSGNFTAGFLWTADARF
jgi:hypothetical protein